MTPNFDNFNSYLIDYWNNGGLVTLYMHPGYPGGTYRDILTPGTAPNTTWTGVLSSIADGLEELQDAGVVVLWRPYHEMCGRFWWGAYHLKDPALFFELWKL